VERARGRDEEHPDVTGGAYGPVAEGGRRGRGLARRRGAPEAGRQGRAGPPGGGAGIEAQREVISAAGGGGGRRQPAGDRRGVRREAPPRRRRHACSSWSARSRAQTGSRTVIGWATRKEGGRSFLKLESARTHARCSTAGRGYTLPLPFPLPRLHYKESRLVAGALKKT
jgi:hypothetical protein